MDNQGMEKLLQEIAHKTAVVYAHEPHWKLSKMELSSPAFEKDIKALSEKMPFPLPPSYRQFLALHDGCLNYWAETALLGTKGESRETIEAEVADALETLGPDVLAMEETVKPGKKKDLGAILASFYKPLPPSKGDIDVKMLTPEKIYAFENKDPDRPDFFVPAYTVFGADGAGAFLFFNHKKVAKAGEYEVIEYSYSAKARERFADFPAFLEETRLSLQKRIKDKGWG